MLCVFWQSESHMSPNLISYQSDSRSRTSPNLIPLQVLYQSDSYATLNIWGLTCSQELSSQLQDTFRSNPHCSCTGDKAWYENDYNMLTLNAECSLKGIANSPKAETGETMCILSTARPTP